MTPPAWRRTFAPAAGLVVAVLLLGAGLLTGRIDLALLALPLAVAAAGTLARPRGGAASTVAVELTRRSAAEIDYEISFRAGSDAEMVETRVGVLGGPARTVVVAVDRATLIGTLPVLHSGPQRLLHLEHRLLGGDGDSSDLAPALDRDVVVAPTPRSLEPLPLPPRLRGLTGGHDSARPGTGGEFRDIHPFAPGDRPRRVDWKATARRGRHAGDLYVRRTAATSDAAVALVLDTRDDVGELFADWSTGVGISSGISSLDLAREAATSIAVAYMTAGDRVGVYDLGSSRHIPAAGGRRHTDRVLRAIEGVQPVSARYSQRQVPIIGSGALVFLLSTFLDDGVLQHGVGWRGSGHRVIAVDVLPGARTAGSSRLQRLGHRIVLAERDERLAEMAARGIELIRWHDDLPVARAARWRTLGRPRRGSR